MTDADTWGYMTYAEEIRQQGIFYKPHHFWYIGYVLLIIGANSIIPGHEGIVIFQYLLAYLALIALYFTSINIFNNPKAAFLTAFWFLAFFMISFWNLFLYAESLLISLYCISFFFLSRAYRGKLTTLEVPLMIIIITWAFLTKPTAIALIAALLIAGLYNLFISTKSSKPSSFILHPSSFISFLLFLFLPAVAGTFLILLNQMLSTFGFVENYQIGEIVYNIHTVADQPYAKWLMIKVPENLYLPNPEAPPLWKLTTIIIMNPWYSIKLFATKAFYYIFYIRPYFSWTHNILALAVLLPMYYFAVRQLMAKNLDAIIKSFVITFLAVAVLSVCLLSINWNGRFLVPILPIIFLIGAKGLTDRVGQYIPKIFNV
ncbi:Dolichyl-phosphate-mannose-protein mannosyltransferase [Belliella buryatensis]|uniref:Dolichyl-phosphate-mannose-protein mannosyltransferase n=1 Tax=Belliella buryatensis TaxID=1500549 RepID=A0A239CTI3_9BACT|nr:glycosyltransferase family 39 protein [Belliella buryatensis]SNS23525.1 Dolichyl-phosphate-mannose-protein mannosyltransferase [Belliella buryatensis]